MKGAAVVRAAAALCVVGMDGMRLLRVTDPVELLALEVVGAEAIRLAQQRDKALAIEIANAIARSHR